MFDVLSLYTSESPSMSLNYFANDALQRNSHCTLLGPCVREAVCRTTAVITGNHIDTAKVPPQMGPPR